VASHAEPFAPIQKTPLKQAPKKRGKSQMKLKRAKRSPPDAPAASRLEKTKANFGLEPRSKKAYDPYATP
jgi:hypothetical protein